MIKLSELSVHVIQNSTIRHTCPKGKLFLFPSLKHLGDRGGGEGSTLEISGWGCATGTLEPLAYTRTSLAEFCYPTLD